MGLDITAYRGLTKTDIVRNDDWDYPDGHVSFTLSTEFPSDRQAGLEDGVVYSYADDHRFRAGSYGGYNAWRLELAKLAGYPKTRSESWAGTVEYREDAACWNGAEGPFSELIDFTDCDGTLGPTVAAKLLKDFIEFDERAKAWPDPHDGWFYRQYCEWRKAMEFAADNGAVDFH